MATTAASAIQGSGEPTPSEQQTMLTKKRSRNSMANDASPDVIFSESAGQVRTGSNTKEIEPETNGPVKTTRGPGAKRVGQKGKDSPTEAEEGDGNKKGPATKRKVPPSSSPQSSSSSAARPSQQEMDSASKSGTEDVTSSTSNPGDSPTPDSALSEVVQPTSTKKPQASGTSQRAGRNVSEDEDEEGSSQEDGSENGLAKEEDEDDDDDEGSTSSVGEEESSKSESGSKEEVEEDDEEDEEDKDDSSSIAEEVEGKKPRGGKRAAPSGAEGAGGRTKKPRTRGTGAGRGRRGRPRNVAVAMSERPQRQRRKPRRMEEDVLASEGEDDDNAQEQEEEEEEVVDRSPGAVRFTPVIIDGEVIAHEMQILENRARAVRYREWELECSQIEYQLHKDRFNSSEASRAISEAQVSLRKLEADVKRAGRLYPDLDISQGSATKFAAATEFLQSFLLQLEQRVQSRFISPTPKLPLPPRADESALTSLPNRPDKVPRRKIEGLDDEEEFVNSLLALSREVKTSPEPKSAGTLSTKKNKLQAAGVKPRAQVAEARVSGEPEFKPQPETVTPLKLTASSIGLHSDEPLFKVHYSFPCEFFSSKVRQRYQHAVLSNQLKSLRMNFSDMKNAEFPNRIETDVVCLPPISNLAGRLPSCGLCGFTVRREDYRGRALKNGTDMPCLVHTYHAYCLAFVEVVCKRVCIAPLMGVASPCNLNERARSGAAQH